ncbi:MAG: DUF2281 domain-containing protein [Sulfurisoma sp.]|nr:DUF2281 domain-containing protein [Sulfurisoma sp.]
MTLAETIEAHVSALPASLQREALDYIAFLEARYGIRSSEHLAPGALATEEFIARHAGSLGNDFPDDVDFAEGVPPDSGRDAF